MSAFIHFISAIHFWFYLYNVFGFFYCLHRPCTWTLIWTSLNRRLSRDPWEYIWSGLRKSYCGKFVLDFLPNRKVWKPTFCYCYCLHRPCTWTSIWTSLTRRLSTDPWEYIWSGLRKSYGGKFVNFFNFLANSVLAMGVAHFPRPRKLGKFFMTSWDYILAY